MNNTNQITERKTSLWIRIASLAVILLVTIGVVAFISISIGSSSVPPTNDQLNSAPVVPRITRTPESKPTNNSPTYTPIVLPPLPTLPFNGSTSTPQTGDIVVTLPPLPTLPFNGPTSTPQTGDIVVTLPPLPTLPANR